MKFLLFLILKNKNKALEFCKSREINLDTVEKKNGTKCFRIIYLIMLLFFHQEETNHSLKNIAPHKFPIQKTIKHQNYSITKTDDNQNYKNLNRNIKSNMRTIHFSLHTNQIPQTKQKK